MVEQERAERWRLEQDRSAPEQDLQEQEQQVNPEQAFLLVEVAPLEDHPELPEPQRPLSSRASHPDLEQNKVRQIHRTLASTNRLLTTCSEE